MSDEQLKKIIYALTLTDRPEKYDLWMSKGFKKIHAMSGGNTDMLFQYWRERVDSNVDDYITANDIYAAYIQSLNNPIPK